MSSNKLTPMMEHYLRVKSEYPDSLLFYRMGDFYELFMEDAEVAARELQLALTSRNPKDKNPISMCGMPHHSTEEYLRRLLAKGYKVAICDQVEDPKQAKGLVKREVTRVLTPGTVVEDINLDAKEPSYLAAMYLEEGKPSGLAWCDVSTGQWTGLSCKQNNRAWQWLLQIEPKEVLLLEGVEIPSQAENIKSLCSFLPKTPHFELTGAREKICRSQSVSTLKVLDLEDKPELTRACGAILTYLQQTQKRDITHLEPFSPLQPEKYLQLDEVTIRNLEIFRRLDGGKGRGTLWHVLDQSVTSMGGRLLEQRLRQPWRDKAPIDYEQQAVVFYFDQDSLRRELRSALKQVYDLERLSTRIFLGRCSPKDFSALRQSLQKLPEIKKQLTQAQEAKNFPSALNDSLAGWDNLEDIYLLLEKSLADNPPPVITEGGLFKSGYDSDLDELIELTEHGQQKMQELVSKEKEKNSLPKLKLGFNKVFGYYFELSKVQQAPDYFIRRQTLTNSERYITEELKQLEDKLIHASEQRKIKEYKLFMDLRDLVAGQRKRFMLMASTLGRLDLWQCLAQTARNWNWTRPEINESLDISIRAGRHPAVESSLGRESYIPNDLHIGTTSNSGGSKGGQLLLITGPNMAGKSTILRQTSLICILAQIGSFVPAAAAKIGLCDRIFSRVGASDNLAQGQSTFMVEMTETARILRQSTRRSLIILDEIGRGTSTFDGLSLAWAVAEELVRRHGGIRTLFATHYHELTRLEQQLPQVRNFNIAIKEWKGDIIFLRRLVPGPADRSYGIEVAKLAGLPQPVVQRARDILKDLDKKAENMRETRSSSLSLPGLCNQETIPEPNQAQPLLQKLKELDINGLTPVQALTLLHEWKQQCL